MQKIKQAQGLFYFCIINASTPIRKESLSSPCLILIPWYGFFSNATTFELSILEPPSVDCDGSSVTRLFGLYHLSCLLKKNFRVFTFFQLMEEKGMSGRIFNPWSQSGKLNGG